jgi:hypothetical protein
MKRRWGCLKVKWKILARVYTGFGVFLFLSVPGCGRHSDVDPAKVRSHVQHFLRESLDREGGREAVSRLSSYRAEGIITLIPERKVARIVRIVDAAGRMRVEFRDGTQGQVHIISESGTWSGRDDRSLSFAESSLLDVLAMTAAGREFPLPYADRPDLLEIEHPDKKKRPVLRARGPSGLLIDYHLDKKSRLAAVSVRAEEEPDLVYRVELRAFRRLGGARFPFRESIYKDDEHLAEVRFRNVDIQPDLPASLFVPRVGGGSPSDTTRAHATASQ